MPGNERWIVLGLGNVLYADEGLGVHALRALQNVPVDERESQSGNPDVEMIDGGTLGLELLTLVEEASHLLVLDAVDAGAQPGVLIELDQDSIPLFGEMRLSQHQLSFQQVLGLASVRGHLPEHLHLIGVQPADLSVGLQVSAQVGAALPEVVARAQAILSGWCEISHIAGEVHNCSESI